MNLKTVVISYQHLDGWPNYSNHTSNVVLHFDLTEEDIAGGLAELNKKIDGGYMIAEEAVRRSIARTQTYRPESPNGNGNGNGHHAAAPPPAQPPAALPPLPPPPPTAQPVAAPPPATGGTPPPASNRTYGAPKTGRQFGGWIANEGRLYREQAYKLCRQHGYPTLFNSLSDEQAVWLYQNLFGASAGANGSAH